MDTHLGLNAHRESDFGLSGLWTARLGIALALLWLIPAITFSLPASAEVIPADGVLRDSSQSVVLEDSSASPSAALQALAKRLEESLALSRPVLLGSRDPEVTSCVKVVTKGQVYNLGFDNFLDWNGGPGSTINALYYLERQNNRSPMIDFAWFQGRLKRYLQNQLALNRPATELANDAAQRAMQFYEQTKGWTSFPKELTSTGFNTDSNWAGYCMTSLDRAIDDRDLENTKHWAGELASATFAMADLHRWFGFLLENHLLAVSFQSRCKELFELAEETQRDYRPFETVSDFPAGVITGSGLSNYYEIERQAERLFCVPQDRLKRTMSELDAELVWVLPELRESFLEWRSQLNASNQKTLDLAARSPFHRSYLMNMLFRYQSARTVGRMGNVLKKFDAVSPHADINELMDVLMYRAQSFAGLEWDDRFQPELTAAGNEIDSAKTPAQALLEACGWTNRFFDPDKYAVTYTLREAIMQKKLDCVRATDMIGTIFRNGGRSLFGHVRWCSERAGHSVAAYLGVQDNRPRTLIVDGLDPPDQPETWPDAYFNGHAWPPSLQGNPTPYAVALYGRGIDSYVWLEGYIIRGPNAGQLTVAAVPYLVGREVSSTRKVFDGPYPQ